MVLNRTSDSLSRCDPHLYSNIYDVRKRPDVKPQEVRSTSSIHKDTIAISRDKLKEEALSRVRHTSKYTIAQNSFMRIGKYLFLAVAFPPYLLVYGLPKWVFAVVLPTLISGCTLMLKGVQKKVTEHLEKGVRKLEQIVQYFQRISNVLIAPVARLFMEIRQGIRRAFDSTRLLFQRFGIRSKLVLSYPFNRLARTLEFAARTSKAVKEKLHEKLRVMTERVHQGAQALKEIPSVIAAWGLGQLQQLKERMFSKEAFLSRQWKFSQTTADKAVNWAASQIARKVEGLKKRFGPAAAFFQKRVLSPCKTFTNALHQKWKQGRDFFGRKQQNCLAFLDQKQRRLKELSIDSLQEWVGGLSLPEKLKAFLQKCLSHPILKKVFQSVISIYSAALSICAYLLKTLTQAANLLGTSTVGIRTLIQTGAAYILLSLKAANRFISRGLRLSLYYIILYTLVFTIILIRGGRMLATTTNAFTKKLTQLIYSGR